MVTERGSILNRTVLSEKIQKRNLRTLFIVSLICLIVGACGVVAYIVLGVTLETDSGKAPDWCEAFLVFAVPFAFGLVFILTINSLIRQSRKNNGVINEYEFFADCLIGREIRGGEVCANVRIEYDQIVKVKDLGEYFFFFYQVKTISYPIDTASLSAAELNTVKKLLGGKTDDGAETVELLPFNAEVKTADGESEQARDGEKAQEDGQEISSK